MSSLEAGAGPVSTEPTVGGGKEQALEWLRAWCVIHVPGQNHAVQEQPDAHAANPACRRNTLAKVVERPVNKGC